MELPFALVEWNELLPLKAFLETFETHYFQHYFYVL